jgi:hypothetical protein
VDLELDGAPSEEETHSRVLYDTRLCVPYFLGENYFKGTACDRVVGLQIVDVELLTRTERARVTTGNVKFATVTCMFITAGPITKLFAWGEGGGINDATFRKILFRNGNLTLALAGWWLLLWARSGCGGSGWAPGWCGWAVASLLKRCCGGTVCWRPAISLPT